MKSAAISELKARLSDYLNQVKSGMEVLVTDRETGWLESFRLPGVNVPEVRSIRWKNRD